MKALLLSAIALVALALPSAAEARGFRGGFRGNFNRGVVVRQRGFVVRQPRVFVAQPQVVVVRRPGLVGRLRGAVRGFRVGR